MTASDTEQPGSEEACIARDMIKHENDLINHRITWFVTLQGLLLAALGFAWDKKDAKELIFVFGSLGIMVSISSAASLWGAAAAIDRLAKSEKAVQGGGIIGRRAGWKEKMLYPWYALPVFFIVAWGFVCWFNWQR